MKRVLLTIAVGSPKYAECALGLGRSLKLIGDTTPRVVITDMPNFPWASSFDKVLEPVEPIDRTMLSKLSGLDRLDADQILFVDCDCLAFQRLDPIFEYCCGKGVCVQGEWITNGEWYGNVQDHLSKHNLKSLPQFNGGLIYYERTPKCVDMLQDCRSVGEEWPTLGFRYDRPMIPDEPCIALALAKKGLTCEGYAHVIPDQMDFTNTATGLIGKLELNVLKNRCEYVCRRFGVRFVRPYIFHASRYINYRIYWKQLDLLEKLEQYESKHQFGYMSRWQRLERSINRRVLKLFFKKDI